MEDIKKYGGDEIYSFSTLYENTLTTNSLYNSDALGQVPYYKSSNCNMDSGEFINSGCNLDYKFLSEFDLFGKEPELYFKGKPQRTSKVGKALTYLYIIICRFDVYNNTHLLQLWH